jgi:hypothetical protein
MTLEEARRLLQASKALHFYSAEVSKMPDGQHSVVFARVVGARVSFSEFDAAQKFLLAHHAEQRP